MSFTVYKSSAGSGKTYTLVFEYLKLIIPDPSKFRNILAITFTNKAANEMKERIVESLRILADPEEHKKEKAAELLAKLVKETGIPADLISVRADESLRMILHHYSDFAIGTIDGFSHRIVRTFARDFGLSINFLVTLESKSLRNTAIDLLLSKAGEDKDLTNLLVRFLETMIDDNSGWNIGKIMMDFSAVLEDEECSAHLAKLKNLTLEDFQKIAAHLEKSCNDLKEELMLPGKDVLQIISENEISASSFHRFDKGFYAYMERISKGNFSNLEEKTYLKETLEEEKWSSAKAPVGEKQIIHSLTSVFLNKYVEFRTLKEEKLPLLFLIILLKKKLYPLAVLNIIEKLFSEFKKENNLVQVAEFNQRISAIISNEPVPFIYERLGEKFKHIMIDEFQDTSRLQWENLLPLIENSLSTGSFNLVVGDGKQAIYRWRNGEVEQFINLPQLKGSDQSAVVKSRENILRSNYHENVLVKNYRSCTNIVEFNNSLFAFINETLHPKSASVYSGLKQDADVNKAGGLVSIEFLDTKNITVLTQNRLLEIIRDLEQKNYHHKDIAILCRSNSRASETARFLMNNHINVVSAESLLLYFSEDVRLLIDTLRFLKDPEAVLVHAQIITRLHKKMMLPGILSDLIMKLKVSKNGFNDILKSGGFEINKRNLSTLPLYDLSEELVRILRLNEKQNVYIQFFLGAILEFTRQNINDISNFLDWWDLQKSKLSVIVPEGMNAVNVMTIHKAKGLQFPVVIYPYANQEITLGGKYLWLDLPAAKFAGLPTAMVKPEKSMKETEYADLYDAEMQKSELDLVNLLYVTMTRAEKALYVLTETPPEKSKGLNISSVFKDFFIRGEKWQDSLKIYTVGELPLGELKKVKENVTELESFISENWRKKISIRQNAPLKWDIDDPQKNRNKGNLLHTLLSRIKISSDVSSAINESAYSGLLPVEEIQEITDLLNKITGDPEIAPYFSSDVVIMNEPEILTKNGSSYRPDRIIFKNGAVTIMDYKTGKSDDHYLIQLKNYENLLTEMGYSVAKKLLLYTEPVVKLTEVF